VNSLPLIIGHRGASRHAPENTLAAFDAAVRAGAAGVEFDVRLSRDGVPVVIHDASLKRTTGRNELVADLTAKQLAAVDAGSWFNRKHPKRADPRFAAETIPSLKDTLKLLIGFKGLVYVELKSEGPDVKGLVTAVCDVIRSSPLLPQIIVKSFRLAAIPEVRCQLPDVKTAALFAPEIMNILRRRRDIITMAREFGVQQLSLHRAMATKRLTSLAADAGLPVTIWTTDEPAWIKRCVKLGIGAVITNDPARLLAASEKILKNG
jgi:glycerophosphoryl diester phosphodiesterase